MAHWEYQRTVIGYHGCDKKLVEDILSGRMKLEASHNDYDWLGRGIYFWEHGPDRAFHWANEINKRHPERVRHPAVIGAVIQLGTCFDLLDVRFTNYLGRLYPKFRTVLKKQGLRIPRNERSHSKDLDLVKRKRDCAMLNWAIPEIEKEMGVNFQTVRCVFQEGKAAFTGSAVKSKSHVQIAVRDDSCILGYFLPKT